MCLMRIQTISYQEAMATRGTITSPLPLSVPYYRIFQVYHGTATTSFRGADSTATHGKVSSLTRLYVPIINRPYSVVGPTNVATDRLGITDASFFNETIRVSNSFGPRARGWKCASSPTSDVAICICPALTFRRYLKQKGRDTKSLLDYLKATSSDSLLCFNTTTMELTHSLPLASINNIGPCSDISPIPFEIAATYLYSFMDLAPASASNKSAGTFRQGHMQLC